MSTKKNAAYNIAYRMFSVLLPLVTAPYLSRVVGTEGVGLYSDAWTMSEIFCLIGMLGLADYGVRTIAQARDNQEELDRKGARLVARSFLLLRRPCCFWCVDSYAAGGGAHP